MRVSIVVAMSSNRVIGEKNETPWHLPSDLKHFKAITMGKPILMGRKTHESIGRPLPGRTNIVLTRDPSYRAIGCRVVHSLEEAKAAAEGASELMVVGGSAIYEALLDDADRIYLTMVHAVFRGDRYFPELKPEEWTEISRDHRLADARNPFDHTFIVLERRKARDV